ncbi:Hsp20/alpha crystallin family protein [Halobaculum marinum]|uniref:Hsp20/alpha crystallin family protein n=1 Tax=Halobaculum marinum TaxID=3031996 RepID=A0ABD5WZN1_9EURY|nr:Hsp20/alpha crystallin family protein [Halobaculum sp. DT55]
MTPFDEMNRAFDRMSRNFGRMDLSDFGRVNWGDLDGMRRSGIDIDVAEYDDEIAVVADLPGFSNEQIDLTVRDGVLSIAAERTMESDEGDESGAYLRRERRAESLRRSITLPAEVMEDDASATYSNGVLTVTLPKVTVEEGSDSHHIDVN